MSMSFKGTVMNGVVALPPEAKLPDGTPVEAAPLEGRTDDPPFLRAILKRFHEGISSIACDLIVQCPSCTLHAAEFAGAAVVAHPKATHLVLAYDCKDPKRPRAGTGASVDRLAKAMFPRGTTPDLREAKNVVIVDDVYSGGKTVAAVVQKLWGWGLDRNAMISVAVALRVMPYQPPRKFDLSEVLKPKL